MLTSLYIVKIVKLQRPYYQFPLIRLKYFLEFMFEIWFMHIEFLHFLFNACWYSVFSVSTQNLPTPIILADCQPQLALFCSEEERCMSRFYYILCSSILIFSVKILLFAIKFCFIIGILEFGSNAPCWVVQKRNTKKEASEKKYYAEKQYVSGD